MGRFRIRAFAALMVSTLAALSGLQGCGDDEAPARGSGGQKDAAGGTSSDGSPKAGSGGSPSDSSADAGAGGSQPDSATGGGAGTTDAADAPVDPNKIVATSRDLFVTDAGEEGRDFDLSTLDIAALVLEGDGGAPTFRIHSPTFPRLGTLEIDGVAPGPYYFRFNRVGDPPFYLLTSTRSLDISSVNHSRPDARRAAAGTTLVLNASGLNAWQDTDDISLYSYNVGALLFTMNGAASAGQPAVGATALNGLTVDYAGRAEVPRLIEGGKGDRAVVIQLVTRALGASDSYLAAGKVFELPVFSMNDAQPTTVSGAFTDVPQSSSISADWKLPEFVGLGAANPSATRALSLFRVSVTRAPQHGPFGVQPEVLDYVSTATTSVAASFNYGNPFASGFTTIADILQRFSKPYAVAGASPMTFFVHVTSAVQATSSVTMRPLVGPIANLRVNGQDGLTNLNGVGRNPTVSWTAPAVGTATAYFVRFHRLFNNAGTTQRALAGFVLTTSTSFVTPPGLMTAGNTYVIDVTAQHTPSVDRNTQPLRIGYPFGEANVLSGMISP